MEAVVYKQMGCTIRFPEKCDTIWNFTNGIEASSSSGKYRIALFLPVALKDEEKQICNGKKELSQMNEDELEQLSLQLFEEYKRQDVLLKSVVVTVGDRRIPMIYFSNGKGQWNIEAQLIAKGYSCIITCNASEKYFKEAERDFMTAVESFKME